MQWSSFRGDLILEAQLYVKRDFGGHNSEVVKDGLLSTPQPNAMRIVITAISTVGLIAAS